MLQQKSVSSKLIFLICLFLLFVPSVFSQKGVNLEFNKFNPDNFPNLDSTITAINSSGVPYQNLKLGAFKAFEDGQKAKIKNVTERINPDVKISVVLAIDGSGSMAADNFTPWNQAKESAINFLKNLAPKDQAALVVFGDKVDINEDNIHPVKEADFTSDTNALINKINSLPDPVPGKTTTPLYDAAYKAVRIAAKLRGSSSGKRAVILFTDGREGNASGRPVSKLDKGEAINQAQNERIPVFTIALGTEPDIDYLQRLAKLSGGNFRRTSSASKLDNLYQEIADKLKTQYDLTIISNIVCDNKEHGMEIKVQTEDGETVNTETFTALCPIVPGIQIFYKKPADNPALPAKKEKLENDFEIPSDNKYDLFQFIPEISARNDIASVEYFIDDSKKPNFVATILPFGYLWDTTSVNSDKHTIRIVAYDNQDPSNIGEATITIIGGKRSSSSSPIIDIPNWIIALLVVISIISIGGLVLLIRHNRSPQENENVDEYDMSDEQEQYPSDIRQGISQIPTAFDSQPPNNNPPPVNIPNFGNHGIPTKQPKIRKEKLPVGTTAFLIMKQSGKQFPLVEQNIIGRESKQCNIVLNDSSISRQHARIKQQGYKTFYIYDLGSTNPIQVNGKETASMRLEDGDVIELGRIKLVFKQIK